MGKPHKHAELIKAWADGEKIQYADEYFRWIDIESPVWDEDCQYRIKPTAVRYLRYLYKSSDKSFYVLSWNQTDINHRADPEHSSGFVRWIDTEWQVEYI